MKIVDTHCHLYSVGLAQAIAANTAYKPIIDEENGVVHSPSGIVVPIVTEEDRLAEMDRAGVDVQVLSARVPSFVDWQGSRGIQASPDWVNLVSTVNDYLASVCTAHPDRFRAFADIPLLAGEAATHELVRALDDLKLHGVILYSNYDGKYFDDPEFDEFFAEANRRRAVIFVHPIQPPGDRERIKDYHLYILASYPYDTTVCATRIVYSGLLERYPDLTFILSHAGGTVPYLWWRLDMGYWGVGGTWAGKEDVRRRLSAPPSEYFSRMYYDTALTDARALEHCYERVGDRILLGSDVPFGTLEHTVGAVREMDVPDAVRTNILGGTAMGLLASRF